MRRQLPKPLGTLSLGWVAGCVFAFLELKESKSFDTFNANIDAVKFVSRGSGSPEVNWPSYFSELTSTVYPYT